MPKFQNFPDVPVDLPDKIPEQGLEGIPFTPNKHKKTYMSSKDLLDAGNDLQVIVDFVEQCIVKDNMTIREICETMYTFEAQLRKIPEIDQLLNEHF